MSLYLIKDDFVFFVFLTFLMLTTDTQKKQPLSVTASAARYFVFTFCLGNLTGIDFHENEQPLNSTWGIHSTVGIWFE